jgi:hypothetical protein
VLLSEAPPLYKLLGVLLLLTAAAADGMGNFRSAMTVPAAAFAH